VQVAGEDAAHVGASEHPGEGGLAAQLYRDGQVENAGDGWVVHRQDGTVGRGHAELTAQPGQLGVAQGAVVVAGYRRVQGDHAQAADELDVVDRCRGRRLAEQGCAERRPLVVVTHHPDHSGSEPGCGRLDDGAQRAVGIGLTLVRQVAGDDDGLRPPGRGLDFGEEPGEMRGAVDPVVQAFAVREQVGVTEMKQEMVRPGVLGRANVHGASIRWD